MNDNTPNRNDIQVRMFEATQQAKEDSSTECDSLFEQFWDQYNQSPQLSQTEREVAYQIFNLIFHSLPFIRTPPNKNVPKHDEST